MLLRGGSRVHCLCVDSSEVATRARTRVVSGLALTEAKAPRTSLRQGWRPAADCARSAFGAVTLSPVEAPREERAVTRAARTTPPARPALGGGRGGPPAALRVEQGATWNRGQAQHAESGSREDSGASTRPAPAATKVLFLQRCTRSLPPRLCVAGASDQEGAGPRALPTSRGCSTQPKQRAEPEVIALRPQVLEEEGLGHLFPEPRGQGPHELALKVPRSVKKGNNPALRAG